jgi:hypothetical protein
MAFVKVRKTKTGVVSTVLVESYRDDNGRSKHRVLANLHGCEDTLHAMARLAAHRDCLRKERAELEPNVGPAERFYEAITLNTLHGHVYSAEDRKDIDRLLKARKRLLNRIAAIDRKLAEIAKEGAIIKPHCQANSDEIRALVGKYQKEMRNKGAFELGLRLMVSDERAKAWRRTFKNSPV